MKPISIRTRLILLITVISCGLLGGILMVVYGNLNSAVQTKVVDDFEKTQNFFNRQELLIYDRLIESAWLIGQNPAFKANVSLGHPPSVAEAVDELAGFTKTDLIMVTDREGKVLSWMDRPEATGKAMQDMPGLGVVLSGQYPEVLKEEPRLWAVEDQLFQVVSVPVEVDGLQLGTLTLGTLFTDYEAIDLKGKSDIDIHIFLGPKLIGSSLKSDTEEDYRDQLEAFADRYASEISEARDSPEAAPVFTADFRDKEMFVFVRPLGDGAPGYYLAMADKMNQLALLNILFRKITLTGAVGFLLALLLAMWLGNQFTRPVLEMATAMDQVRAGDLQVRLVQRSRDEYGRLTGAFNEMIQALRERLQLSRYVGSHTMKMIQTASGMDVERSQRLEMAVLFSDIRGFTAYAEAREPEVIIAMLNAWLGFQSELVLQYGGVVDKFVGDEVLALFIGEDAVARAWDCARHIQKHSRILALERNEQLTVGIGLHYGPVVMGNVGAGDRLDYTVIGSTVNLASRLCSAARGGELLITEETMNRLGAESHHGYARESMKFKGFSEPVSVMRLQVV